MKGENYIPQIINFLRLAFHIILYYFCLYFYQKYSSVHAKHTENFLDD